MLASLSNKSHLSLLVALTAFCIAGCTQPEIDRAGTWKATGINDQNLRAMLVNQDDAYVGTGTVTSRGNGASRAVTRLLTDRRRPLLDATTSSLAPATAAPADSALPASSSGGGSSGGSP